MYVPVNYLYDSQRVVTSPW